MSDTVADSGGTPDTGATPDGKAPPLPRDVANAPSNKEAPAARPKIKIGDWELDEVQARSEIERGRQSGKLLTEAQKRLEAADRKEREQKARFAGARGSPAKLAEMLTAEGWSRDEILDHMGKYIYENEIVPKQMSPEQRRIRELEAETAKFKAEREGETKKQKAAEFQQQVQQEIQKLKAELEPILANKKIPNTRVALKRMAMYLKSYQEAGVSVPAERAVDMLMQDYQTEFGDLLENASPDQLEAFLGKERMTKFARAISQWALARAKVRAPATDAQVNDITKKTDGKKLTPNDFTKFIGGIG